MKSLQSIKIPHEIVNDEFVTIIKCHFNSADKVNEGDPIVTIETSKMVDDLYAGADGYISYRCGEGDEIKIGEIIAEIYEKPVSGKIAEKMIEKKETSIREGEVIFSKSALRLIEELKLNKDLFKGRDFVSTEEVRAFQRPDQSAQDSADIEFQKITPFKKREIEYLKDVQSSNLSSMVSMLVDVAPFIDELRAKSKFFKNSLLPIALSRLPSVLREYPEFNAFYKEGMIGFYKHIAIGVAVNLGEGLRVLKLSDTEGKSIAEIEAIIFDVIKQYVDKKLTAKDVVGVTFTVTDLSNEGVHFFVPLIPKAQSAILGISAIDEKLQRSIISLSFDHRVTDGKKASEFLKKLKKKIETYSP